MRKIFTKISCASVMAVAMVMSSQSETLAQDAAASFIKGGIADANKLMNAYLTPFGESFGANMNSGWYNTGQALKPGRFELKVVGNFAFAPTDKANYDLFALGFGTPKAVTIPGATDATEQWLLNGSAISATNGSAPTVFGESDILGTAPTLTKRLTYTIAEGTPNEQTRTEDLATFPLPPGTGLNINPIPPAVQLSVGLIKKTELMLRYVPSINQSVGENKIKFSFWGVGVKHDFKQWIPGIADLPFDLSAVAAYSSLKTSLGFTSIVPAAPNGMQFADPTPSSGSTDYDGPEFNAADYGNQALEFNASGWNGSVLISKKISVLTVYGGVRYSSSKTTVKLAGTYGFASGPYFNPDGYTSGGVRTDANNPADPTDGPDRVTLERVTDPINLDMKLNQIGVLGGVRIKLAIISFFAEAQYSKYNTVSAGISLGWFN